MPSHVSLSFPTRLLCPKSRSVSVLIGNNIIGLGVKERGAASKTPTVCGLSLSWRELARFDAQTVSPTGEQGDSARHLQVKKCGVDLAKREIRDDAKPLGCFSLATGSAQSPDERTLLRSISVEEFQLDIRRLAFRFPIHQSHQICGIRDEFCSAVANEVQAPTAEFIVGATGKSADRTIVISCKVSGDQRPTFFCALDHQRNIGQTGHDAIAAHEISGEGAHTGHIFREQTSVRQHLSRSVTMHGRIDRI